MSTSPAKQFNEDAGRIMLAAIEQAIAYAKKHGIALDEIRAAALEVGELLMTFGAPVEVMEPPGPALRLVYPPSFQLCLELEPVWRPSPRQATRSHSRPMLRTSGARNRTGRLPGLFDDDDARTAAMLAAGFRSWAKEEAS